MPHLLTTTQVYPPETCPAAVVVRELAEYLVSHGWQVTVCAGLPHHPHGRLIGGFKWRPWQRTEELGVEVVRVGHLIHKSRSTLVRGAVYTSQALATALAAATRRQADVVLVYGPPLVGANLGAVVAARHKAKLVNIVYDIYPDIAVETGRVKNLALISAARFAEQMQYKHSDLTIVLSEGFRKQIVSKGVAEEQVAIIPMWLDPDEIRPMMRDNVWRREHGIGAEKFVVLYAGTIGVVSGASIVADTAALVRDHEDILFLFVGEGEEKAHVEARARKMRLTNMMFLPFQPRERLCEVQASADVSLVTLAKGRGRTSVPSKVVGYMAAGRPVIASVDQDSDTAAEVISSGCGLIVAPEDPVALAEAILGLSKEPRHLSTLGRNARKWFLEHFSAHENLRRFDELLRNLASSGKNGGSDENP